MIEITTESTCQQMLDAASPDAGQTALRIFQFDKDRLAFVINGPEAEQLSVQFIQFAEALFNAIEEQMLEERPEPKLIVASGT